MATEVSNRRFCNKVIKEFGEYIIKIQDHAIDAKGDFNIAIDIRNEHTGCTVFDLFEQTIMNNKEYFDQIHWEKWKIYIVSENLVSFESTNSHYKILKDRILDPLVHKYGHLNMGPTVVTINENLLDSEDKTHIDEKILVKEYQELLPPSFDLLLLSPLVELDINHSKPVIIKNNQLIFLNGLTYDNARNICFIIDGKYPNISSLHETWSPTDFKQIRRKFAYKVTTFTIPNS